MFSSIVTTREDGAGCVRTHERRSIPKIRVGMPPSRAVTDQSYVVTNVTKAMGTVFLDLFDPNFRGFPGKVDTLQLISRILNNRRISAQMSVRRPHEAARRYLSPLLVLLSIVSLEAQDNLTNRFGSPLQNASNTNGFGEQTSAGTHTGVDLVGGTTIRAAAFGKVVALLENGVGCTPGCVSKGNGKGCRCNDHGLGNTVIIEHTLIDGNTVYSLYGHNASFADGLTEGSCVAKGEAIATIGGTGYGLPNRWDPHLHLEIKAEPELGSSDGNYFGYVPLGENPTIYGYLDPYNYIDQVAVRDGSSESYRTPTGSIPRHPIGTPIRQRSSGTIFALTEHEEIRGISSEDVLSRLYPNGGFGLEHVVVVGDEEFALYRQGPPIVQQIPTGNNRARPDGTLIASPAGEISIVTDNGGRRPFDQLKTFEGLGFSLCNVVHVSHTEYDSYAPVGRIVDGDATGTVGNTTVISSIVSAADFGVEPVAPGALVSLFGMLMGPTQGVTASDAPGGRLTTELAGVEVLFDGIPGALFFVRSDQVNLQVPYSVDGRASTQVHVRYAGQLSPPLTIPVHASAPRIFMYGDGSKRAIVLNQDGSLNNDDQPAYPNDVIVFYATGEGQTTPAGVSGQLAVDTFPKPALPVSVEIGQTAAEVLYAGAAPGFAGLMQVNTIVPSALSPNNKTPLSINVGDSSSQADVYFSTATAPSSTLPDLRIVSFSSSALGHAGRGLAIAARVRNDGPEPALPFQLTFAFYSIPVRSPTIRLDRSQTYCDFSEGLRGFTEALCEGEIIVPDYLVPSRYGLIAAVDSDHQIRESNESNNTRELDTGTVAIYGLSYLHMEGTVEILGAAVPTKISLVWATDDYSWYILGQELAGTKNLLKFAGTNPTVSLLDIEFAIGPPDRDSGLIIEFQSYRYSGGYVRVALEPTGSVIQANGSLEFQTSSGTIHGSFQGVALPGFSQN